MDLYDRLIQLQKYIEKIEQEKKELIKELEYVKSIEKEAVRRYNKVADELLLYYIHYGKIDDDLIQQIKDDRK